MSARVNGDDPADPASTNDTVSAESAGAPASAAGAAASDEQGASAGDADGDGMFECNICFEQAKDAVVSLCGHLFCWPCLHTWLETKRDCQVCPVCKAAISRDKVVPLYGRNSGQTSGSRADPRDKPPPRPAGHRSEPEQSNSFGGFNLGDANFHFSFGIGAFPLGFIASAFNVGRAGNNTHAAFGPDHPYHADDQALSTLFLALGIICVLWLLCM